MPTASPSPSHLISLAELLVLSCACHISHGSLRRRVSERQALLQQALGMISSQSCFYNLTG
jgi:hypothetical protein